MTDSFLAKAKAARGVAEYKPLPPIMAVNGSGRGYAQAALTREADEVRFAAPGTRNDALNRAAFSLGQLVGGGELAEETVRMTLTAAALSAGLDRREIDPTIASGLNKGLLSPRQAPRQTECTPSTPCHGPTCEFCSPAGWIDGQATGEEVAEQPTPLDVLKGALVDSAGLDDIPDPEPLIGEDIVFRDTLVWMVGKPGCGKSFSALDMAGCIATGEPWQTYRVQQGRVLYLVAEGVRGVKKRVRAWEQSMGHPMTGVDFLPIAVQSTNGAQWDAFVQLARENQYALIVIDTQSRVTVGVEENSNTEMGEFVHQAERLRAACAACVLIVHHIGRNGETGRGATVLDGALSTIIKVTKDEDQIRLECTKNKDAAEWDDINLRVVPTGESVVLMLDDGLSPKASAVSHAALKMGITWWEHHADSWVTASNLVDVVAPKTTFYRNVRELEREHIVEIDTSGRWPRYRISKPPENGPVGHVPAVVPQSHP
ncbi:AAA domain-containing protein [Micromonospora mirobrigensis]|uniref:AAA domain-containing protein n=1 Tax=Micromonospora mirobrigensis TaxID=262898 RepID=A0A1C4YPS0_9ACTN|nr:AAA domain-containing protein [Micromonospora mirobrigensis]